MQKMDNMGEFWMQNWRERLRRAMQFSVRDTAVTLGILAATTGLSYELQVFESLTGLAAQ